MNKVCITGITGQTGSYLAEIFLQNGYDVYGLIRRTSNFNTQRIEHIFDDINLSYGDLSSFSSIQKFIQETQPDIFINAAAQSHVRVSFDVPEYTMDTIAMGNIRCLEALRINSPQTRYLHAATSEMFGSAPPPQNENTPFHPRSPYACAKVCAYYSTINYREAYKMHASNSISFNHESPRRGHTFVTKKITKAAARIKYGLQDKLRLGNLDAKRDWSHAKDIAHAMYLIVTADKPDDYVIGSGKAHSIKEFLEIVFKKLDLNWEDYVVFDEKYLRPTEVDVLCSDNTKIKEKLFWEPEYSFEQLIDEMIDHDLKEARNEKLIRDNV
ncbi:MAG: GDP-mannose 4,6-dehydratase [Thioploca sp.]|nr:GDP-mannose 4,6-dehydratase [Thioploca sp.]